MYSVFKTTLLISFACIAFLVPQEYVSAEETYTTGTVMTTVNFRFNNENWFTVEHPKVASFSIRDDGSAYGLTETGIPFEQYNVENSVGIRIQRFEIQEHYHYIIEGEIANTFEELSARLAQAYAEQNA